MNSKKKLTLLFSSTNLIMLKEKRQNAKTMKASRNPKDPQRKIDGIEKA